MRELKKGMKVSKLRCKVNLIANATCSNIHVQVICSAKRPRAFGKAMKLYETHHIDYYNNITSWTRTEIFVHVIEKFSNRVHRRKTRVTFMETFSAHDMPTNRITPLNF